MISKSFGIINYAEKLKPIILEERICTCGHKESIHVTGRKDGVGTCMDCIEEGISNEELVECEGFVEKF